MVVLVTVVLVTVVLEMVVLVTVVLEMVALVTVVLVMMSPDILALEFPEVPVHLAVLGTAGNYK